MKNSIATILSISFLAMTITAAEAGPKRTNGASKNAINQLKGKTKKQKGVIYVNGKRLTACIDWGRDKGWCKKHNN